MKNGDGYAFANSVEGQRDRLKALEVVLDPGTLHHLAERGVGPGWHCLEVGAGAGSVARWLAERVGPDGRVLATDLNLTAFGEVSALHPSLTAVEHDVMTDPLPEGSFDLVHTRLVLAWLADPTRALDRLVAALKPGGSLVVEELDFVSAAPDPSMDAHSAAVFARVLEAHTVVLADRNGFDPRCGRRLHSLLRSAGLTDVNAAGRVSMWRGGEPGGQLWRLTLSQLRQPMTATGLVDDAEVNAAIDLCLGGLSYMSPITMTSWGHRPNP